MHGKGRVNLIVLSRVEPTLKEQGHGRGKRKRGEDGREGREAWDGGASLRCISGLGLTIPGISGFGIGIPIRLVEC